MPLFPSRPPTPSHIRTFSSTCILFAKSTKNRLIQEHAGVPPYPYGPSQIYKQSNFGLYGLAKIRFGNIVSEKNEIKTRRYWRPNVHKKRLWSESLGMFVRVRITARVLRTVDKCGGLDEYLLGDKAARIRELGMGGWKLRWRIMQTEKVKERFRRQRVELGLEPLEEDAGSALLNNEAVGSFVREFDEELGKGAELDIGGEDELTTADAPDAKVGEDGFMEEKPAREEKVIV